MSNIDPSDTAYGYIPSLAWNAAFVALFSVSLLIHIVQATRTRYWILFPTLILGALIEVMGYAARVWSHFDVLRDGFLMQICLLIMAPVFFSAYCYVVLGTGINRLGERYSIIPAKLYFLIFILADLISLILQAVGGGQAASGAGDGAPTQSATDIMVAGILFQLVSMGVFIACGLDFVVRVVRNRPYAFRIRQIAAAEGKRREKDDLKEVESGTVSTMDGQAAPQAPGVDGTAGAGAQELSAEEQRKWALVLVSVMIASTMILVRGVFRSIELSEGWDGHLVQTEIYQMCLDGIPMVIAVGIFNVLHPGVILGRKASWKGYY